MTTAMTITGYHKRLYASLALVYMLPYIQSVGLGVISNDLMQALSLTPQQMGVLGSAYLYAYAAVQLFSGMIAVRFGPRLTLSLMFIVTAVGCALFALSGSSYSLAITGRALCGAGMAVVLTSALTVFGRWFPPTVYARICAWFFSIGGLGSFIATAPLSFLNDSFGWRNTYLGLGLITALGSLLIFLMVRDWPPAQAVPGNIAPDGLAPDKTLTGEASGNERKVSKSEREAPEDGEEKPQSLQPLTPANSPNTTQGVTLALLWQSLKKVARLPDFWKLCSWYAFMSGTFYAFGGLWAGPYLADVYALSKTQIGGILSMGAVGFVVGNPVVTWLCEYKLHSYRLGLGWACVVGFVGVCMLVFLNGSLSLSLLYLMALLLGMAANAPNAVGYAAARTLFGARLVGTIGGILGFSSFIGGACLQVLCGWLLNLAQNNGVETSPAYAIAFAPFLLCVLIGGWAGFSMTESFGRDDFD